MTLRYDRLDNFWFTLVHELAHLYLHLDDKNVAFFDDTEQLLTAPDQPQEQEANEFTNEILIPSQIWNQFNKILIKSQNEKLVLEWANRLEISPAILAGRIRWETKNYFLFSDLVGNDVVREKLVETK